MQTTFTQNIEKPRTARKHEIFWRACVHCAFAPHMPRPIRFWAMSLDKPARAHLLIKDMLENDRDPDEKTVKHIERCPVLSCRMTTLPCGRASICHLVDHAATISKR